VNIAGFERDRPHASRGRTTVYRARRAGEPTPRYAIKSFQPSGEVADRRDQAAIQDFLASAEVQERLAKAGKRHWAPVYASGAEGAGAFYVTRLFPGSAQQLVKTRARINSRVLHAILSGTVKGLRELGRPHGNLKPSNVLLGGRGRPRQGKVFLTDPLPDDKAGADPAQDLRALGDLLYQLVCHREAPEQGPATDEPKAWAGLGLDAPRWRALCHRLLDPAAGGKPFCLKQAEADLKAMGRRLAVRRGMAVAGAAGAVAVIVWLLWPPTPPPPDVQWEHLRKEYAWFREVKENKALVKALSAGDSSKLAATVKDDDSRKLGQSMALGVFADRIDDPVELDQRLDRVPAYYQDEIQNNIRKGHVNDARLRLQYLRIELFTKGKEHLDNASSGWPRPADSPDPSSWSKRTDYLEDLKKRVHRFMGIRVPDNAPVEEVRDLLNQFPNAQELVRALNETQWAAAIGGKWPEVQVLREDIKGSTAKDKLRWFDTYLKERLSSDKGGSEDLKELAGKLERWTTRPDGLVIALQQRLKGTHWDCVKLSPALTEDKVTDWLKQIQQQNELTPWSEALAKFLETTAREQSVAKRYLELLKRYLELLPPESQGAVDLTYKVPELSKSGCCPACLDIESVTYGHEKARKDVKQVVAEWAATRTAAVSGHLQERQAAYKNPLKDVHEEIIKLSNMLLEKQADIKKVEPKGTLEDADLVKATIFKQRAALFLGEEALGDWRERVRIHTTYLRGELKKEEDVGAPPEEVAPLKDEIGVYEALAGPSVVIPEKERTIHKRIKDLVTALVLTIEQAKASLASALKALGTLPPPLKDATSVREHIQTARKTDADNLLDLLDQPPDERPANLRTEIELLKKEADDLGKALKDVKPQADSIEALRQQKPFTSQGLTRLMGDLDNVVLSVESQNAVAQLSKYAVLAKNLAGLFDALRQTFPPNPNVPPPPKAMPIPPEAVEAERQAAVEKTVKQNFPDLKSIPAPEDAVRQKLQADAAAWQQWLGEVRLLADRAGVVDAALGDGCVLADQVHLDGKPPAETVALVKVWDEVKQVADGVDSTSPSRTSAVTAAINPLRGRIKVLEDIEKERDPAKAAAAAEKAVGAKEVAVARTAWAVLGKLDWPTNKSELAKDRGIRRQLVSAVKVEYKAAREAELQKGARERWERYFGRLTKADGTEESIVKAIEDINDDSNKDVREFDLSNKLDNPQALQGSDVFNLAAPREQYNVLRWWLQQTLDKAADTDKAKVDEVRKLFADTVEEKLAKLCQTESTVKAFITWLKLQKPGDDEGATDWSKVGPGEFGWTPDPKTEPLGNNEVRYTWQAPINNGPTYELTFRRLLNQPCLLCTTEARIGLVGDWLLYGKPKDRNAKAMTAQEMFAAVNKDRSFTSATPTGPCVYIPDPDKLKRFSLATEWLKVPPGNVRQEELYEGPNELPPARDAEDKKPKDKHPMNQISAQAALQFARLLNCRLPTVAEWKAAYDEDKDWKDANLRGRTWWDQRKYLKEHYKDPADSTSPLWPGAGSFATKILHKDSSGKDPKDEAPPSEKDPDGGLWFERVDKEGKHTFKHLVGNVMEFTCENKDLQDKMPADASVPVPSELKSSFGVAGGSALSPRSEGNFQHDRPYPLDPAYTTYRFSDVGFRLALSAPKQSLRERILVQVQSSPNKGFLPPKTN